MTNHSRVSDAESWLPDFPPPYPPSLLFQTLQGTFTAIHACVGSLFDCLNKVLWLVMTPTSLSKRTVQWLRQCSHHRKERDSDRLTILVKTSQLHLCLWLRTRDKAWECWLWRCLIRRESQVQPQKEFITLTGKNLCHAHRTLPITVKFMAMCHRALDTSR